MQPLSSSEKNFIPTFITKLEEVDPASIATGGETTIYAIKYA